TPILYLFFHCYRSHRHLHSFPTRRSSDLAIACNPDVASLHPGYTCTCTAPAKGENHVQCRRAGRHRRMGERDAAAGAGVETRDRSEEHTSELQSLRHLVCRLLLEKKKKKE